MTPKRSAAFFLILIPALLLFSSACDDAASKDAPMTTEAVDVERGRNLQERLGNVLVKPWMRPFPIRRSLTTIHTNLVAWAQAEAQELPEAGTYRENAMRPLTPEFEAALEAIESGTPIADELLRMENSLRSLIDQLEVPREDPFPLRNRFEQGCLKAKGDYLRLWAQGLDDVLAGRSPEVAQASLANLDAIRPQMTKLGKEAVDLARVIHTLDGRFEELPRRRRTFMNKVLKTAEEKRAPSSEDLQVLLDQAEERLLAKKSDWHVLRKRIIANPPDTEAEHTRFLQEIDEALNMVTKPFLAAANRLGIRIPRRDS